MYKKEGYDQPRLITTKRTADTIEELYSQDQAPHTLFVDKCGKKNEIASNE